MNEKECEVTSLNFVWKIFTCFMLGLGLLSLWRDVVIFKDYEILWTYYWGIPIFSFLLFFLIFHKMRYSESGIDYIIGIIREDGSVSGYIRSRPWDSEWNYTINEELGFFATLMNKLTPFAAFNNNLVLKNFSGACRMIYKYQVMLTERDKKLLRKYGKIDKYESKKLRNSKAAKLWDSVPED